MHAASTKPKKAKKKKKKLGSTKCFPRTYQTACRNYHGSIGLGVWGIHWRFHETGHTKQGREWRDAQPELVDDTCKAKKSAAATKRVNEWGGRGGAKTFS